MEFTNSTCREFVDVLATKSPVPGGGGASALVGAIGTALGNMVGSLTVAFILPSIHFCVKLRSRGKKRDRIRYGSGPCETMLII